MGRRSELEFLLINLKFPVRDDGDILSRLQKLHHGRAIAGQLRPSGLGVWILFQTTQFSAFEPEIYLFQFAFCGLANRISFKVNLDRFLFVDQGLLPD